MVRRRRPAVISLDHLRKSGPLLNPREYLRITSASHTFVIKSTVTPRIPLPARQTSLGAYKRKAPPSFLKYPIFLQVHHFSKLFNIFGVHITDLSIGAFPVGTPPTALILFLSFTVKLIYTRTSNHQTPTNRRLPRHPCKTVF